MIRKGQPERPRECASWREWDPDDESQTSVTVCIATLGHQLLLAGYPFIHRRVYVKLASARQLTSRADGQISKDGQVENAGLDGKIVKL